MIGKHPFLDTNILLYALSADDKKAELSESLLSAGGTISVQVLNEFASVASRKLSMAWAEIEDILAGFRMLCDVEPITLDVHDLALTLASKHDFALYDAVIVASALTAGCDILVSEDFQHGMRVGGKLRIRNPFKN